jgi:phytoene dehydrogenase-like protein
MGCMSLLHDRHDVNPSLERIQQLFAQQGVSAQIDKSYPNEWNVKVPLADGGYVEIMGEPFGELAALAFDAPADGESYGRYRQERKVSAMLDGGAEVDAFVADLTQQIEQAGYGLAKRPTLSTDAPAASVDEAIDRGDLSL